MLTKIKRPTSLCSSHCCCSAPSLVSHATTEQARKWRCKYTLRCPGYFCSSNSVTSRHAQTMTSESAIMRFIMNRVSGQRRPVSSFTTFTFCFTVYGKNAFWATWSFWLQYLERPLKKINKYRHTDRENVRRDLHTTGVFTPQIKPLEIQCTSTTISIKGHMLKTLLKYVKLACE